MAMVFLALILNKLRNNLHPQDKPSTLGPSFRHDCVLKHSLPVNETPTVLIIFAGTPGFIST